MGTTTPNISIYIPSAGETNYDTSFAAGMVNIDQHDHSGAPNKGVPLSSSGIADGSITRSKLNSNVVLAGGGLAVDGGSPNALKVDGVLLPIYQLASNGFISRTSGTTASARTITGTANQINVSNGDGVSGNPTLSLASIPTLSGVNGATAFALQIAGLTQANLTAGSLDLSGGNVAVHNGTYNTGGVGAGASTSITGFIVAINTTYLALTTVKVGAANLSQISIMGAGNTLVGEDATRNVFGTTSPTLSINTGTGQVSLTNNAGGSLEFTVTWFRLL